MKSINNLIFVAFWIRNLEMLETRNFSFVTMTGRSFLDVSQNLRIWSVLESTSYRHRDPETSNFDSLDERSSFCRCDLTPFLSQNSFQRLPKRQFCFDHPLSLWTHLIVNSIDFYFLQSVFLSGRPAG